MKVGVRIALEMASAVAVLAQTLTTTVRRLPSVVGLHRLRGNSFLKEQEPAVSTES